MKLTRMSLSPLDEYLQTMAYCQWAGELAEAVAMIPGDQEQRHVAWKTLARLLAGRNDLRRIYFAYIFLRHLLSFATCLRTVSLVIFMQGEFLGDYPNTFRQQLDEARNKAVARIGQ